MDEWKELEAAALGELLTAADEPALRAWNTAHFGDKGKVKAALGKLKDIPKEQRAAFGQEANRVKVALESGYSAALDKAKEAALARQPRQRANST